MKSHRCRSGVPYRRTALLLVVCGLTACCRTTQAGEPGDSAQAAPAPAARKVDFARDIRPVLSDKCFACHGPGEESREGGFRLDVKDSALGEADSGAVPIVPGDLDSSELYQRLTADDASMRMPPEETNKQVTPEEIAKIAAWIRQGAPWQDHWAYQPPRKATLPEVVHKDWPRNEIDYFVLERLEQESLSPSSPADKITLLRRVTLDLTGLPPTPADVQKFLADPSPSAYEHAVDRLLASPSYGEHMARFWLDAARYGDTHGLHLDNYREIWAYRDWVVRAFNANMPYDQFTIEQLAGDLLPDRTDDQLIATGFNRCNVTTNEGGSITEEVYVRNVVDRVVTAGTVFLGATFDCTRCHDHKYDPYTMKDFYSLFAYFNSIDGSPMDGNVKDHAPVLRVLTEDQKTQLAQLGANRDKLQQDLAGLVADAAAQYEEPADAALAKTTAEDETVWIDDGVPTGAKEEGGWQWAQAPLPVLSGQQASTRTASGLSQHFFTGAAEPLTVTDGLVLFTSVYLPADRMPQEIMLQWNDGGWDHRAYWGANKIDWGQEGTVSRRRMGDLPEADKWVRLEVPAADVGLKPGAKINGWAFTQFDGTVYWDQAGAVQRTAVYQSLASWEKDAAATGGKALPKPVQQALQVAADQRDDGQRKTLREYFVEHVYAAKRQEFQQLHAGVEQVKQQIATIEQAAPTTLIFKEKPEPRPAYVLQRGEYDQHGEEVTRRLPPVFPPLPDGAPNNRLGLARWLVDPGHPLTARVAVNRFWQQFFGVGLVKTADDFGSQGEMPSHPELLDWLAVQFREDGWDVKKTVKRIVMSATYQQTSQVDPSLYRRDPENRLLARGSRFRLDAEALRDQALDVSGLLDDKMGGPSVKPPQPDGLWFAVGYSGSNTVRFQPDSGPDKVHRRTLYTFIKRTAPPPELSTFDAPSREACCVRRERTNTPLQALLLMNDPQYFECARALGERVLREGGNDCASRARWLFEQATCRVPDDQELATLAGAVQDHLEHFQHDLAAARQVNEVAGFKSPEDLDAAQLAAWTMLSSLVLNLDEVITRN